MSTKQIAEALLAQLPTTPDVYPHNVDFVRNSVLLIRREVSDYVQASFLDDRSLGQHTVGAWLPIDRVQTALAHTANQRPLNFLFHTGHVGSTLISRLLDDCGAILPLREPLALRTLAEANDSLPEPESLISAAQFDAALNAFVKAWQRGYDATLAVVLKATSSAGRLATSLLQREPTSRAAYINLRAEPYLATLLAGANSWLDLRGHGAGRLRRLNRRLGEPVGPLHSLSLGELAAMSWLCETLTQHDCVRAFPERVLPVDFDQFLADVTGGLTAIWSHFQLPGRPRLDPSQLANRLAQYSKSPTLGYSPEFRAQLLADARRSQAHEMGRGLQWLQALAARNRSVAALQNSDTF